MKYLEQLEKINSEICNNMGKVSQKTIDVIQDTFSDLNRDTNDEPIQLYELGSINYDVSILLEIWNPALEYDIDVLKRFNKIIKDWKNDI